LAAAAILLFFWTFIGGRLEAVVTVDGQETMRTTIEKKEAKIFFCEERPSVAFSIGDNAAAIIESDCPDQICVRTGALRFHGQSAVCLPNRIALRVVKINPSAADTDLIIGTKK